MITRELDKQGNPKRDYTGRFRYLFRFRRGGRSTSKRVWARDDREAQQLLALEQNKLHQIQWGLALKMFLEAKPDIVHKYQLDMTAQVNRLIQFLGDKYLDDTTHREMVAHLNNYRQQVCGRTVNKARTILLTLARWCRSQGLIETIPFEHVPTVQHRAKTRIPPPIEKLPQYLDALDETTRPIIEMLAFTGARSTAFCRFMMDDIHPDHILIHEKGGVDRTILLDDTLRMILEKAYAARRNKNYSGQFVFVNTRNNPWTAEKLLRACQRKWKHAGLEPILIHELRHLWTTIAASHFGASMVQAGRGDRSRATAERYTHLRPQDAAIVGSFVRDQLNDVIQSQQNITQTGFIGGDGI